MNKDDLRKVLKPLIKECIKEVIFEEGTLSTIISEVVTGLDKPMVVEAKKPTQQFETDEQVKARQEKRRLMEAQKRKKLLDSIGGDAYNGVNLFEGTEPLHSAGSPSSAPSPQGALSGVDARDPGVDISGLFGQKSSTIWKKLSGS
jgi:hypothetical protein